jgi:predicted dehydrogenase
MKSHRNYIKANTADGPDCSCYGDSHCELKDVTMPTPTRHFTTSALLLILFTLGAAQALAQSSGTTALRAGMIGLDTSHVNAFTNIINSPMATGDLAGLKIVAGYPGGTDIPASRDRVEGFTEDLRKKGVEIVDTIGQLLEKVDVVLLESVDGRIHLEEAAHVIKAGKPLFIDKPVAGSLADAIAIYDLAKQHSVPVWSASSIRFSSTIQSLIGNQEVGDIVGCSTWGPCSYQEGIPDMFFYGIHGIEGLFTVMGTGCESVTRTSGDGVDLVTGLWKDGRVGTFRGIRRGKADFGATAYGTGGVVTVGRASAYDELCRQIARFFATRQPPVSAGETIEIFAFMEAADESKRQGGVPVTLESVLQSARSKAKARLAEVE